MDLQVGAPAAFGKITTTTLFRATSRPGPLFPRKERVLMRKWLRRIGTGFGVLAGLLVATYLVVYVVSSFRLARKYEMTRETIVVPEGAEAIERGRHLATAVVGCTDCHDEDFGGKVMIDSFALGRIVSANLTPAGIGASYSTEDWVRALRHGLDRKGRPLKVMPSELYQLVSQEDLGALIAFLRQLPPVERDLGQLTVGPLARVLYVFGALPIVAAEKIDHRAAARFAPPPGVTAEYGRYLAETSGCMSCHGDALEGKPAKAPGFPDPPRIARLSELGYGRPDFVRAMRQGLRPDGSQLSDAMPWRGLGRMTDDELGALWLLLENTGPAQAPVAAR
jgi:cytochrome c553